MNRPIGVFDSGLGGLSILREIVKQFPHEDFIYLADNKYCPYGNRTNDEIRGLVTRVTAFFIGRDVKGIVIACNTATANSNHLTLSIPVVGMIEPTSYEVSKVTKNKKVLVLATEATVRSNLYSKYLVKYGIKPIELAAPKFVSLVENLELGTEYAKKSVANKLKGYANKEIDTVVLGCTHFGFLRNEIEEVLPGATLVDGSKEVSAQLRASLLERNELSLDEQKVGTITLITTGDLSPFEKSVKALGIRYDKIIKIDI